MGPVPPPALSASDPSGFSAPSVAWTARIGDPDELIVRGGRVYAWGDRGIFSFAARCRRDCEPLWKAKGDLLTVEAGVVYASRGRRIVGFEASCRDDGGSCSPLFRTPMIDVAIGDPDEDIEGAYAEVAGGYLYASFWGYPVGGNPYYGFGRSFAFASDCRRRCPLLWRSPLLQGIPSTPVVSEGRVYVSSASGLDVFAAGCRGDGLTCRPLWRGDLGNLDGMTVNAPVFVHGHVLLTTSNGNHGGGGATTPMLAVFPVACQGVCEPEWSFELDMIYFPDPPVIRGARVYLDGVVTGRLAAYSFSLPCATSGGPCSPRWVGREGGALLAAPGGVLRWIVPHGPGVDVQRVACSDARDGCPAIHTLPDPVGGDPLGADRSGLYLATNRTVFALSSSCARRLGECEVLWSHRGDHSVSPWIWGRSEDLVFVAEGESLVALDATGI
jgi:hypothetical protein